MQLFTVISFEAVIEKDLDRLYDKDLLSDLIAKCENS